MILNFGRSLFDAGIDFVPNARRYSRMQENGTKIITFDVRLSNTAAKSDEWVPVKPGTDLAVVLAMCHVIIAEKLYDKNEFETASNLTIEELKTHIKEYSPEWAERKSSVPLEKIKSLAIEFAKAKPSLCISFRGAFMHHNGIQARRAIYMLDALVGNLGSIVRKTEAPKWVPPFNQPNKVNKRLDLFKGVDNEFSIDDHIISNQIAHCIDIGQDKPEIYLTYTHNPVYSNGNSSINEAIYKDTSKIPFLICSDVAFSETSRLADLILPDTTFLERWTLEDQKTVSGTPEYYIRQPLSKPLGESINFVDVACDLAKSMDIDLGFSSAKEFVEATCNNTPGIKEAGGFEFMAKNGIWHDKKIKPSYVNREKLDFKSKRLEKAGFSAIPDWMEIPSHVNIKKGELMLTTYKVSVQAHSRTQNCKWLSEIYHDNPAWINTKTAKSKGIENKDWVKLESSIGELVTRVRVTQAVHPDVIAISHHLGHQAWGVYATGKKSPVFQEESDVNNIWWDSFGTHVNNIIPITPEPISGSMAWFDTVVKIKKIQHG